jgi:hypothetical protein
MRRAHTGLVRRILLVGVLSSIIVACCWPADFDLGGDPGTSTPSASVAIPPVTVLLDPNHPLVVSLDDLSGLLVAARPAVVPAGTTIPPAYGTKDIAAWNPSGQPSAEVLVYWGGVICDTASLLVIGPQAASLTVYEGPVRLCDASNDGRGVILTFSSPVDASGMTTTFVTPQQGP